jgi:hypothetical protein
LFQEHLLAVGLAGYNIHSNSKGSVHCEIGLANAFRPAIDGLELKARIFIHASFNEMGTSAYAGCEWFAVKFFSL